MARATPQDDEAVTEQKLVQWFEDSEEASDSARKFASRDRDYYDGKQLTDEEISELQKRGQPDIVINRIRAKVNFLLGLEVQQRSDPKAFPRTPKDTEASEAATDALRYVKDKERLEEVFSEGWEELIVEGVEACEVHVRPGQRGMEIDIQQWNYDRVFFDPHSRKRDFSDANYMGGVTWMDLDKAKERWPNRVDALEMTANDEFSAHHHDRPSWRVWARGHKRKRVRIVQMYYRDKGEWFHCTYTKGGKLDDAKPVPYLDEEGESDNPMILQSAYVDRENNRYGEVRSMIGPQDEINKRRSKLLHMLNVRTTKGEKGAVADVDEAKMQMAKADGHVEVNPGMMFEPIDQSQQIAGQAELLQEAKFEIENMGPNASLQGKGREDASGRAIIASQQGGIFEATPLTDRHRQFKLRVYKAIWNRIRQFWDEERWVRVTDNEDNIKFVGFNRPVTIGEEIARQFEERGADEQQAQQLVMQLAQERGIDPQQLQQVVRTENVPAEMDMDIIIEEAPDSITIQQEQFEQLSQILPSLPVNDPRLKILIQASSLRNKKQLIEQMEEAFKASEEQQQAAALQMEQLVSEIENKRADTAKKVADTQKTIAETEHEFAQVDKTEAETFRTGFEMTRQAMEGPQTVQ